MTSQPQPYATPSSMPQVELGFASLLIAVLGLGLYFRDGITSLFVAWSKPEYSHGWLIPVVAGYLLVRALRNEEQPVPERGSQTPGLVMTLCGIVVGLLGNVTQIPYFITYGLIIVVGGLILMVAGVKRGLKFWPAWFYLLFMLPLPTALYWQLSAKLQFLSSGIGVEFIRLLGVPVFLEGNVIDLGVYQLQVAEACSGLRYLFPLSSFGFLFAVLYKGPLWHRILLFLSSFPITVLMNSLRIGVIGILVNSFGSAQAEGFLHWFEGWIIFVACMAILFAEAWILQRFVKNPQSALGMLSLESDGMIAPLKRVFSIANTSTLTGLAVLSLVAGLTWVLLPRPTSIVPSHKPLVLFPAKMNGWTGQDFRNPPETEKALGADDYLSMNYTSPSNTEHINFFVAFYNSTTDGTGIHNPEICIPGGGWEVSRWDRYPVVLKDAPVGNVLVNRAVIQKGFERKIVYYWFRMRGHDYASEYWAKFNTIWDSAALQRADGALVRFTTDIGPGESLTDGDKRLASFMPGVLQLLPDFVPN